MNTNAEQTTPFDAIDLESPSRPATPFSSATSTGVPTRGDIKPELASDARAAVDASAAAGRDLMARVAGGLHGVVDSLVAKVAPAVERIQGGYDAATDRPREWSDAARTAIREKPFVAVAGALVVGAALLHLLSSSKR